MYYFSSFSSNVAALNIILKQKKLVVTLTLYFSAEIKKKHRSQKQIAKKTETENLTVSKSD
ncbi:hypothetical protein DP113_25930 [Brasilonema octagenarum UFV-E1]|uniref:Uncharacterized protein n=1 Tax=Brasilonema sennae CENA114 TaxID=415709 RepID=A0A856MNQ2_9CYAN|nr:hypothetical protein DP114_26005 [Brasilonema sennae CENA114]QDL17244.1 hypothetical protein DP113_25930 [Brasilonema octagenarum UFV-E1]